MASVRHLTVSTTRHQTLTNWGAYEVETDGREITAVHPFAKDPDPSPIGRSLEAVRRSRVARPSIRESWYRNGPGSSPELRGHEPFVEVTWAEALDLLAAELERIRSRYGNQAIFGGSYGWASAGRFHHAQSQIHRFLNSIGGYTYSVDDYSIAAGHVITPHVFGLSFDDFVDQQPNFVEIAENTDLVVAFGGMPMKNSQVNNGGQGRHMLSSYLDTCHDRGVRFVNLSPLREDLVETLDAEWIPLRPCTDTALMLGLAHTLYIADAHDEEFLERYCVGWEELRAYLLGEDDEVAKTAEWASAITGVPAGHIRTLALQMANQRTLLTVSWSVQRNDHGEQPYWMAAALAAMLGQIGLPGGGLGYGYGAVGLIGHPVGYHHLPRLPQGKNPVETFIPVARIADLLLSGGGEFDYNGGRHLYPETRLVYWAGGNPFHHHQDLNRLAKAWQTPDTIVCHEPFWNALAKHSDIVLPATTPLERNDIGGSGSDDFVFWMDRAIEPVGEARNDYDIFSGLAERLGVGPEFTENRTADEWLVHLYESFRSRHPGYPDLDELREAGHFQIPAAWIPPLESRLVSFREDPEGAPLRTPSGRIELYSETIADFGYDDCPPHPSWLPPAEWLGNADGFPLHLISNQPKTRLHSQWDHGETSINGKVDGRELLGMTSGDATARGLEDGDLAKVFNERGACLAVVRVRDDLMSGVVQLPTGAWWDPSGPDGMCKTGNPNVLTRDVGTSSLAQGPTAQTCLVEVEAYNDPPPAPMAHEPPRFTLP
jgi:biotin/methionine sulfoxide reductase